MMEFNVPELSLIYLVETCHALVHEYSWTGPTYTGQYKSSTESIASTEQIKRHGSFEQVSQRNCMSSPLHGSVLILKDVSLRRGFE